MKPKTKHAQNLNKKGNEAGTDITIIDLINKEKSNIGKIDKNENDTSIDKTILDLINEEISYIRNEELKPGWTVWAVIATISSLVWLFFNEIENQKGHFETVILFFAILEYLYLLFSTAHFIVTRQNAQNPKDYFRPVSFNSINRFRLIVSVIEHVGLGLIAYHFQEKVNLFVSIIAYIINLYLIILLLASPFLEKKLEQRRVFFDENLDLRRTIYTSDALLILAYVFLSYAYIQYSVHVFLPINISDIRFVCIIFAIIYLFNIMGTIQTQSPVLDALVKIRRDYILGKINTLEAKKRAEIALSGLRAKDVQQEYIQMLKVDIDNAEREINEAAILINNLNTHYQNVNDNYTKKESNRISDTNRAIFKHLNNYSFIMKNNVARVFVRSLKMIKQYNKDAVPYMGFFSYLNDIIIRLNNASEKFSNAINKWLKLLEAHETKEIFERWKNKVSSLKTAEVSFQLRPETDK